MAATQSSGCAGRAYLTLGGGARDMGSTVAVLLALSVETGGTYFACRAWRGLSSSPAALQHQSPMWPMWPHSRNTRHQTSDTQTEWRVERRAGGQGGALAARHSSTTAWPAKLTTGTRRPRPRPAQAHAPLPEPPVTKTKHSQIDQTPRPVGQTRPDTDAQRIQILGLRLALWLASRSTRAKTGVQSCMGTRPSLARASFLLSITVTFHSLLVTLRFTLFCAVCLCPF